MMMAYAIKKEKVRCNIPKIKRQGKVTTLAEAIILQSIEDLFDDRYRKDCRNFFFGEGFRTCAEIAKMKAIEQIKLINLVNKYIDNNVNKKKILKR